MCSYAFKILSKSSVNGICTFLNIQFIKLFQIGCSLIKHLKIDSNQVKANCQVFFFLSNMLKRTIHSLGAFYYFKCRYSPFLKLRDLNIQNMEL